MVPDLAARDQFTQPRDRARNWTAKQPRLSSLPAGPRGLPSCPATPSRESWGGAASPRLPVAGLGWL